MSLEKGAGKQSYQLGLLTFVHFLADCANNAVPGFLPVAMAYFTLDLSYGVGLLSVLGIGCNLLQIPLSKLGGKSRSPVWIITGLILLGCSGLIGLLPRSTPFIAVCGLLLVVSLGIAMVHPAGLRGVQALEKLPAGMTTPIFMTGGFFGAALAPLLAGLAVERFGLKGLLFFFPLTVLVAFGIWFSGIRLQTDGQNPAQKGEVFSPWNLWSLLAIATFLNCGSASFTGLVPYMLNKEHGFPLWYSGFAIMLFGGGSSAISVLLGMYASRKRIDGTLLTSLFCGIPFAILFFCFAAYKWALIFSFACGALCSSVFPIFVAMAKTGSGKYSLGVRMGLMVGGTWGVAGLVFLGVGILADHFTAKSVLMIAVPVFYLLSGITAVFTRKSAEKVQD
ncbi:MAG: MFS transporter [Lentisphaeria bacterium]|nr:MFS transporter [Lentisphaeria bacterium]